MTRSVFAPAAVRHSHGPYVALRSSRPGVGPVLLGEGEDSGWPYAPALGGVGRSRPLISVLVIDDDATFRELATHMLEGMGLSVVGEAETIEAAVVAARKFRPQAALIDVALPDGSGVALAVELAALPWRPRIVLTSTDAGAVTEADARSAGAAAFIAKQDLPDSPLRALLTEDAQVE